MSDIVVSFKAKGEERLIEAINKLQTAQKGNTVATDKANKSLGLFDTTTKRNAKNASNLGVAFSTMRSKLLLLNFALGMGIRQMMKFAEAAAKVEAMAQGFNTLAGGSAKASIAIDKLNAATNGTLSNYDLFQQANNAMILGVTRNSDEMADLFSMAKKLGDALGRDTASSVESLVTGIGRQSRMMLDNLGIVVDTKKAYKDYASELKKNVSALTDAEKKQAFMNATLAAAREKIKDLPEGISENNESLQQFDASMTNLSETIGEAFLPLMTSLADVATKLANAMTPERVRAYTILIGVGLVGALVSYEKQLKKVIVLQSRTGWGLLATGVGFLVTELVLASGVMDEAAEEAIDLADETKALKDEMEQLADTNAAEALEKYYTTLIQQNSKLKLLFAGLSINLLQEFEKAFAEGTKKISPTMNIIDSEQIAQNLAEVTGHIDLFRKSTFFKENEDSVGIKIFSEEQLQFALDIRDLMSDLNEGTEFHISTQKELEAVLMAAQIKYQQTGKIIDKDTIKQIVANEKVKASNEAITQSEKDKNDEKEKAAKLLEDEIKLNERLLKSHFNMGKGYKNAGSAAVNSAKAAVSAKIQEAVITYMAEAMTKIPFPASLGVPILGAAMAGALGSVLSSSSSSASSNFDSIDKFAEGGYVGGRPHSQGGTIIEAERGEFVMSRNAVESIGLESLNQMNQSGGGAGINVTVTGNVLTQDFVEGELAESIKEAVRRGSDFGLS